MLGARQEKPSLSAELSGGRNRSMRVRRSARPTRHAIPTILPNLAGSWQPKAQGFVLHWLLNRGTCAFRAGVARMLEVLSSGPTANRNLTDREHWLRMPALGAPNREVGIVL